MSKLKPTFRMSIRNQLRQWYKNIPNLYHGSFRQKWIKALQHRSMKAAVTAKCQDCMAWQNTEVRECNIVICPLWQYRPFRDRNGEIEAEVIAIVTEIGKNDDQSKHKRPHSFNSGAPEGTLGLLWEKNGSNRLARGKGVSGQAKPA